MLLKGHGAWAFEPLAQHLASALWVDVTDEPAALNYVLSWESPSPLTGQAFIPIAGVETASDKRLQAERFTSFGVASPRTYLLDHLEAPSEPDATASRRWVLKYPTSSGASGHRFIDDPRPIAPNWPRPFVVQEFIDLDPPEVYRLYGVDGALFGWNVRRLSSDQDWSRWVAHATGASYTSLGDPPGEAVEVARAALDSCDLLGSFGCVDLLPGPRGWLALEVGTDGYFNHVDRDVGEPLATEIDHRLAEAFWARIGSPPWGNTWHYRR